MGSLRVAPFVLDALRPVRHHGEVSPVRLRVVDDRNLSETLRTVAYRASCSCGWRGEYQHEWRDAVIELGEHKRGGAADA